MDDIIDIIVDVLHRNKRITFLTGAGISTDSGIPTFRGNDGYWTIGSDNYAPQTIATKQFFDVQAYEVWKWYLSRFTKMRTCKPNIGHESLVEIENMLGDNFRLISQNVDSLHRKAGNSDARTMLIHGDGDFVRCSDECTSERYPFPNVEWTDDFDWNELNCPKCGEILRPNVLFFDEIYNELHYKSQSAIRTAKETGILFIIGTSGATYLPEVIVQTVLSHSGYVIEVNLDHTDFFENFGLAKRYSRFIQPSSSFLPELEKNIKNALC